MDVSINRGLFAAPEVCMKSPVDKDASHYTSTFPAFSPDSSPDKEKSSSTGVLGRFFLFVPDHCYSEEENVSPPRDLTLLLVLSLKAWPRSFYYLPSLNDRKFLVKATFPVSVLEKPIRL